MREEPTSADGRVPRCAATSVRASANNSSQRSTGQSRRTHSSCTAVELRTQIILPVSRFLLSSATTQTLNPLGCWSLEGPVQLYSLCPVAVRCRTERSSNRFTIVYSPPPPGPHRGCTAAVPSSLSLCVRSRLSSGVCLSYPYLSKYLVVARRSKRASALTSSGQRAGAPAAARVPRPGGQQVTHTSAKPEQYYIPYTRARLSPAPARSGVGMQSSRVVLVLSDSVSPLSREARVSCPHRERDRRPPHRVWATCLCALGASWAYSPTCAHDAGGRAAQAALPVRARS